MGQERNKTIDIIKGIAIILVLITHYSWTDGQRLNFLFPYLIDMAVPVFMIISGYVGAISFRNHNIRSLYDSFSVKNLMKKATRYSVPYLIAVVYQIIDSHVSINVASIGEGISWFLNGTSGPGSYYYPILMQLIFLFPIIFFIVERYGKRGIWICLTINAVYEILKWSYGLNEECYRLLIFRYIFVIATGVYTSKYDFDFVMSIAFTAIGGVFLWITTYSLYTPHIITSWTSTCFISTMWVIPIMTYTIRNVYISFKPLEAIGKASYNIFLVQMIFYKSYFWYIPVEKRNLFSCIIICLLVGILFYYIEVFLTKKLNKLIKREKMG